MQGEAHRGFDLFGAFFRVFLGHETYREAVFVATDAREDAVLVVEMDADHLITTVAVEGFQEDTVIGVFVGQFRFGRTALKLIRLLPEQHFTQPPARYTEATLVKALEENGIGRPSTYASILTTIQARGYVVREAKRLYPTETGTLVTDLLVGATFRNFASKLIENTFQFRVFFEQFSFHERCSLIRREKVLIVF